MAKRTKSKIDRMYEFDLKGNAYKRPEILPAAERKALTINVNGETCTEYQAPSQIINQKKMLERYHKKNNQVE